VTGKARTVVVTQTAAPTVSDAILEDGADHAAHVDVSGISGGAIAGIIIAIMAVLAVGLMTYYFGFRKKEEEEIIPPQTDYAPLTTCS
jgi:hypothetical protein